MHEFPSNYINSIKIHNAISYFTHSINKIWRWVSPSVGEGMENHEPFWIPNAKNHLEINLVVLNELGLHVACHWDEISGGSVFITQAQRMTALRWPTVGHGDYGYTIIKLISMPNQTASGKDSGFFRWATEALLSCLVSIWHYTLPLHSFHLLTLPTLFFCIHLFLIGSLYLIVSYSFCSNYHTYTKLSIHLFLVFYFICFFIKIWINMFIAIILCFHKPFGKVIYYSNFIILELPFLISTHLNYSPAC